MKPPLGFIPEPLLLPLSDLLPSRKTPDGLVNSRKYKQILTSIDTVGVIEPLSVGKPDRAGLYILLDGHARLVALKQLGFENAPCHDATDDESSTYNTRINRLSSIEVLPITSAKSNLVKSVFEKENGLEEAVFRRTDHRFFEAGGGRRPDQGAVPTARI